MNSAQFLVDPFAILFAIFAEELVFEAVEGDGFEFDLRGVDLLEERYFEAVVKIDNLALFELVVLQKVRDCSPDALLLVSLPLEE